MRTKIFHATDSCQTLAYVIDRLTNFCTAPVTRGKVVKTFVMAAIEDDGWQPMVHFPTDYYVTCWTKVEWPPVRVWKLSSSRKSTQKVAHNIKASVRNTLSIFYQYKY